MREKKIYYGEYLDVDIIHRARIENNRKGKRSKKKKVSAPKQRNLNEKNSRRYFVQIVSGNFGKNDLHVTVTYSEEELPATVKDGEKEVENYRRRINYRRKKEGLEPMKYVQVTEHREDKDGKVIRMHHHLIISGGLDRDIVESLWSRRRKKGEKEGKRIGFVNADRLQPNNYGLEALSRYLMKHPQGKKRWSSSKNLDRPTRRDNNYRYTRRKVERIIKNNEDKQFWENQYPGYWFTECKYKYNDLTGWSIYLRMRKADSRSKKT